MPGKRAKFIEGKTVLIGITFPPKNFQELLEVFRSAVNKRGENAFHYHPLKPSPGGGKIQTILDKTEQLVFLDWIGLSYDQTKVGLTKATEQRAWGFREIADTYNTEAGPLEHARKNTYSGENLHSLRFGQTPAAYARKVDITSLHVALTPAACNIHIDNVGFVLRGPRSVVGLDVDFLQHMINERVVKSMALGQWIVGKYGESAKALWAIDHLSLMLPSTDTRLAPMAGVKLDLGKAQLTAAFTPRLQMPAVGATLDRREDRADSGWMVGRAGVRVEFWQRRRAGSCASIPRRPGTRLDLHARIDQTLHLDQRGGGRSSPKYAMRRG